MTNVIIIPQNFRRVESGQNFPSQTQGLDWKGQGQGLIQAESGSAPKQGPNYWDYRGLTAITNLAGETLES